MTREIMAHASISTTQKYLECDLAACRQAVLDIGRLPMPAGGAHLNQGGSAPNGDNHRTPAAF
jgi:hypothetical protein